MPGGFWELLTWSRMVLAGALLALSFHAPGVAFAQGANSGDAATATVASSPRMISVTRVSTPPTVDGRPDDPAWLEAAPIDDFRTYFPREGAPPTFRTEFRVAFDDRALYVLVRAFDPHPDSIVRLLARRDTDGPPNDQVQLFIDSFHDRRGGYEFIVNAAGVKSDYILFDDTGWDQSWDGIWEVATSVDELGWVAEFAIPFRQLRYSDSRAPTFGLMVWRVVGRLGERVSWPAYGPSIAGLVSQAGTLAGLSSLPVGTGLEVIPYLLGQARSGGADGSGMRSEARTGMQFTPAIGADLRYLPRPSVSIDATINPDFGQIEADPALLNLEATEVRREERRPFFLEGAGLLSFPLASDGDALLFYSRRIGRRPALASSYGDDDTPTATTIHSAARLTARLAPGTSLAALSALTREEVGAHLPGRGTRAVVEPRAHYAAARLQHDLRGGRSGLGLMLTRVDRWRGDSLTTASLPAAAHALAATLQHQTGDGSYRLTAWGAASEVRGSESAIATLQLSPVHAFQRPDDDVAFDPTLRTLRGSAGSVTIGKYGGGPTRFSTSYRWVSAGFDVNEMGYLTVADLQSWSAEAGLKATEPGTILGVPYRSASTTLGFAGDWSTAGLPLERGLSLRGSFQLPNQVQLQSSILLQLPGAYCTVSCTRGGPALVDPPGQRITAAATGDPRRALIPHLELEWLRDDDGRTHGTGGRLELTWRARSNLETSLAAYAFSASHDAFFYRRFGSPLSDTTHYTIAALEQETSSLTARVNYTITRDLSVQWHSEVYLSQGRYARVRELADPRATDYERRFRPYDDPAVTADPGGIDFNQLRSNAVLRWEFRPGSTLFLVWSQERARDEDTPGPLRLGPELRDLLSLRPGNTVAVKVSYWLGR